MTGPAREQPTRATPPRKVRAAGTPGCSAKRTPSQAKLPARPNGRPFAATRARRPIMNLSQHQFQRWSVSTVEDMACHRKLVRLSRAQPQPISDIIERAQAAGMDCSSPWCTSLETPRCSEGKADIASSFGSVLTGVRFDCLEKVGKDSRRRIGLVRAQDAAQSKLLEQLAWNIWPAPNAVRVKVVVRSKLQRPAFFDLYVDNVVRESAIWQNGIENRPDRLLLQREYDEILHRGNRASSKSRGLFHGTVKLGRELASRQIALKRDVVHRRRVLASLR